MATTSKNKRSQGGKQNNSSNGLDSIKKITTNSKVLTGVGIAAGAAVLAYIAYKYIPFGKIYDQLEETYEDTFQEKNEEEFANA